MNLSLDRRRLLVAVTDDWFAVSHFLPVLKAARDAGMEVAIACRIDAHGEDLRREGFILYPTEAQRGGGIAGAWRFFRDIRRTCRSFRPDIVHLVALRPIVLGGLAHALSGSGGARILAVTGLGYLGTQEGAGLARAALFGLVRLIGAGQRARFVFENRSDGAFLGLSKAALGRARIVGGAGIDPERLLPLPLPPGPGLKATLVARMVRSKGIETAIAAIRQARAKGADISLTLAGAPDPGNPASLTTAELSRLDGSEGISWIGPVRDLASLWAAHHVCVLPSHGGEGLPRSLLEAAAYGRAIITTDVPGCRDFVRDRVEGMIVPPRDIPSLAGILERLAADPSSLRRMGDAARARVLDGFTEKAVSGAFLDLYRDMAG
jgi:glycosyltransferase involved in cell wall biosynthesis